MGRSIRAGRRSHTAADARFSALYDRYYARVLAYVLRRTTPEAADDVVAETFLVAWRRIDRLSDDALPWLLAVARKTLANQRRGERRRSAVIGQLKANKQIAGVAEATDSGQVDAVAQAVARLSELDQELLRLVLWDGLSTKEAASVVGISHGAGRVRMHRAKRRLGTELAKEVTDLSRGRCRIPTTGEVKP